MTCKATRQGERMHAATAPAACLPLHFCEMSRYFRVSIRATRIIQKEDEMEDAEQTGKTNTGTMQCKTEEKDHVCTYIRPSLRFLHVEGLVPRWGD